MNNFGKRAENASLETIGLNHVGNAFWNLTPAELVEDTIINGMGVLTDTGALAIETGEFTGRSPADRFIVADDKNLTVDQVKAYCKDNLAGYKVPRMIEFRDELPMTNVGKILRRALREEEAAKA